jgi:hypothetical protein
MAMIDIPADTDRDITDRLIHLVGTCDELSYASAYALVQDVLPLPNGWQIWRDALREIPLAWRHLFAAYYARRINERWPRREETAAALIRNWALLTEVMPWE